MTQQNFAKTRQEVFGGGRISIKINDLAKILLRQDEGLWWRKSF